MGAHAFYQIIKLIEPMKRIALLVLAASVMLMGCKQNPGYVQSGDATVYLTRDISPEALVNIYKALGVPATGRVDIINQQKVTATNDPTDLLSRIDQQHGVHTIEHAEAIGLGSRKYTLVSIDK